MKCNGCGTPMMLDKSETGHSARADWYRCPLCAKVRLTSHLDGRWNGHSDERQEAELELAEGPTNTGAALS